MSKYNPYKLVGLRILELTTLIEEAFWIDPADPPLNKLTAITEAEEALAELVRRANSYQNQNT